MRIGIDGRYIQDHYPGIGRYTYQLALALARLNQSDDLVVFTSPANRNSRFVLGTLASLPNVHLEPCPGRAFTAASNRHVARECFRRRLDVFHAPHYQIPWKLSCPLVTTLHDLTPWIVPGTMPNLLGRLAFIASLYLASRRAARVITGSHCAQADLSRILRIKPAKLTVIPHGVDQVFHPLTPEEFRPVLRRLNLSEPYMLYCGSNKPHKNLERLVQSWAMLPESARNTARLVLAGAVDTRYATGQALAQLYDVQSSVTILGECSEADLVALYNGACAFVFPSLYEGFGLPVLEAMACGCPVTCANNSSLPEVAGDAATYFDPTSCAQISAAMLELIQDEALRHALQTRAAARVKDYSWERTALATRDVYQAAVERSRENQP